MSIKKLIEYFITKVYRLCLRLFAPKLLAGRQHNDPLAGYFDIEKTRKLLAQKYYWQTLQYNVQAYIKSCDVCLILKAVQNKSYGKL